MVPSESVEELSDTPDHPLSSPDPLSWQKPTPGTLFPVEIVAKLNNVILESVQLRISGANNSDVGEL